MPGRQDPGHKQLPEGWEGTGLWALSWLASELGAQPGQAQPTKDPGCPSG